MKSLKRTWFAACVACSLQCHAFDPSCIGGMETVVELETGYRWDRVSEMIEIVDSAHLQPYLSSENRFKELSSYQLGARGLFKYNDFVIKGTGHYGWILDGSLSLDLAQKGNIHGHTWDASGAVGYLFNVCDCFKFIPLIGGSYDSLHFKATRIHSFNPKTDPPDHCHEFDVDFYSPWVGVDILFDSMIGCRYFSYIAGYEFHYGWAHSKNREILADYSPYSYHTQQRNMMGHVFHFNTQCHLQDNWLAGLRWQYSYWGNAHSARSRFASGTETGLTHTQSQRQFKLSWYSIAFMLAIGKEY